MQRSHKVVIFQREVADADNAMHFALSVPDLGIHILGLLKMLLCHAVIRSSPREIAET